LFKLKQKPAVNLKLLPGIHINICENIRTLREQKHFWRASETKTCSFCKGDKMPILCAFSKKKSHKDFAFRVDVKKIEFLGA